MAKRILIVDDEQNRRLLNRQLDARGYTPLSAATGEEGLKLARPEKPDLVALDIGLPGELMGDMGDAFSAGAGLYVNKPYHFRQLLTPIERLLA